MEDNWLVAIDIESALGDAGYDVVGIAINATEALEICQAERPQLVLMDIRLQGGSDGVAAAIAIKSELGIPVIFVSAHDDPDTRLRAKAAHPLGWVVKPISGAELVEKIIDLTGRAS